MKNFLRFTTTVATIIFSGLTIAATHVEEVWDCKLIEGKTMKQVNTANADWMKYANANVKGGGINSRVVTPVVGDYGGFFFVDSFPNLKSWADTKAVMATTEGAKKDAAILAVVECSSNRLYNSTD
jgi:hypothetical protein